MPSEHVERDDIPLVQLVAHELESAHGLRSIDDDTSSVVDDSSTERTQVFHEPCDQAFITGALRDEAVARAASLRLGAVCISDQFLECRWLPRNEVGSAVKESYIRKPGEGIELAHPRVCGDPCREKIAFL